MHSDYDSAENIADSDLEDGELRKMPASLLNRHGRGDSKSSRVPTALEKPAAMLSPLYCPFPCFPFLLYSTIKSSDESRSCPPSLSSWSPSFPIVPNSMSARPVEFISIQLFFVSLIRMPLTRLCPQASTVAQLSWEVYRTVSATSSHCRLSCLCVLRTSAPVLPASGSH